MKKLRYSRRAVRSQEQSAPLETSIFAEQQAQAKSGVITAPTGADATIKALGDASPVTNTLAGVMRDAFGATGLDKIGIINLKNRTVTIVPAGTTITSVTAGAGITLASIFVKDDPTKASSSWTDDEAARFAPIVAAEKPAMSVESLSNRVEDFVTNDPASEGESAIIVIDQANSTFKTYIGTDAAVAAIVPATLLAEDANFVQTLTAAGGAQFGE